MAQSEEKINKLFDKKWAISTYKIAGQIFQATNVGKDDCTFFYPDHSVKSIDHSISTLSKWKYDASKNSITLYSENVTVITEMKILSLTENEFVWETTNPECITMIIHMLNKVDK